MIEEAKGDHQKLWKAVNVVCNRNSTSENFRCNISDGIQHTTPKSIASALNSFFASNYRPISILPTLSKILEKAVHSQLHQYLVANNLLTRKQFGFRKGLSTVSALTSFADEVLLNIEQGKLCGAVFLD